MSDSTLYLTPLEWFGERHDLEMIKFIIQSATQLHINFNTICTPDFIDFVLNCRPIVEYLMTLGYLFNQIDVTKIINWKTMITIQNCTMSGIFTICEIHYFYIGGRVNFFCFLRCRKCV